MLGVEPDRRVTGARPDNRRRRRERCGTGEESRRPHPPAVPRGGESDAAAPPSNMRPTWNAETIVEPNENVSGSTSVLCWLIALVYGSELICNRVVLAAAVDVKATVSTTAPVTALRRPTHRTGRTNLTLMRAP